MTSLTDEGLNDFIQFHHNPIIAQKNEEIAHLQKLCEEQKGEIAQLNETIARLRLNAHGKEYCLSCASNAEEIDQLQRLYEQKEAEIIALHGFSKAPCGHIVNKNDSLCRGCQVESQLAEQREEIEALEERIENLNDLAVIADGKLATQTERIRGLEEALKHYGTHKDLCASYHFESFSDGKNSDARSWRVEEDCDCGFWQALNEGEI